MRNAEIAERLQELGDLYELDGAVQYRVIAYREAARAITDSARSVADAAREGRATEISGVGKTIQEKIVALLDTGEIPAAVKLKAKFPATLVQLTRVDGLGAKTARRIYDELGIADLDGLDEAARDGRLRDIKGLGPKAEENIIEQVARLRERGSKDARRRLLSEVLPVGQELVAALRELPEAGRVELAGSARRWAETCKDIDIIATADDPAPLTEALANHPHVAEAGSRGEGGTRVLTHEGLSVDLRIVPPEEFGNLLQHFTGSKTHNVALREDAVRRGYSVSEHGITTTESGDVQRCATEDAVYEALGYAPIPPELREGRGELAAAREGTLPTLVGVDDIRGDLHCHTTLSDGTAELAGMVDAARERGYEYLAVTDHSASHGFGNHVTPEMLRERIAEARELDQQFDDFRVLVGSEVNVLPDGALDYDDELLAELDWVIASVHTAFRMSREAMTDRIIAAVQHPQVDCMGHLTGRLIGKRDGYDVEIERIVAAALDAGTMFEINGNPRRRDLNEHHARLASEAGVPIVCTTDAHRPDTLGNMPYGIATARRAWLGPEAVANTRPVDELLAMRKPTRG